MTKLLILFIILNIVNVILQTIKSIATVKCDKFTAAIINAIAYGLYTVILVYMNCDLTLMAKVLVVGGANLIGVYVVKAMEERNRKDKLWKIEMTIKDRVADKCEKDIANLNIPYNTVKVNGYKVFNIYCATQTESLYVKEIVDRYNAKYFVSESKAL